jgi:hypothetical protein
LFDDHFLENFAPFLLYGGFVKLNMNSLDWYADVKDFGSITLETLKKDVALLIDEHRVDRPILDFIISYEVIEVSNPPHLDFDANLFVDTLWWDRLLRIKRKFPDRSVKEVDAIMRTSWGKKLYKP